MKKSVIRGIVLISLAGLLAAACYKMTDIEEPPPKLSTPTGITAEAKSSGSITLSWNEVPGAVAYKIYRAAGFLEEYSFRDNAEEPSWTDTDLERNTSYYYKVSAIDSENAETGAGFTYASTWPLDPPLIPDPGQAASELTGDNFGVRLTWTAVSGAVSYQVYYSPYPQGNYKSIGTTGSATFDDKTIGVSNYYKILAIDESGNKSPLSEAISFTRETLPITRGVTGSFTSGDAAAKYYYYDMTGTDCLIKWEETLSPYNPDIEVSVVTIQPGLYNFSHKLREFAVKKQV